MGNLAHCGLTSYRIPVPGKAVSAGVAHQQWWPLPEDPAPECRRAGADRLRRPPRGTRLFRRPRLRGDWLPFRQREGRKILPGQPRPSPRGPAVAGGLQPGGGHPQAL